MTEIEKILTIVMPLDDAKAVVDHRRITIKKPLTCRAASNLTKQFKLVAEAYGDAEVTEAVDMMIDKAWQGFKAQWYFNARTAPQGRVTSSTARLMSIGNDARRLN